MRKLLAFALMAMLAGCIFPGFDYDTEPEYPDEFETDPLDVFTVPASVNIGEQLVVRAEYSYEGEIIEGATCIREFESVQEGMSYSSEGYLGNLDTGGMGVGTYSVGVKCSKAGYTKREGGATFTVVAGNSTS